MGPLVSGVLTFRTLLHKDMILNVVAASTFLQSCHLGFKMSAVGCSSLHQVNVSMISALRGTSCPYSWNERWATVQKVPGIFTGSVLRSAPIAMRLYYLGPHRETPEFAEDDPRYAEKT